MKLTTTTTTLFALFLLSALTSLLPSTTAEIVFDIDGDPLRNGGTYYIRDKWRAGIYGLLRGIEVTKTENEFCPLTVVQLPKWPSKGLPIIISTPVRTDVITEGVRLNLSFAVPPSCSPPTEGRWTIVSGHPLGQQSVKLDGYEGTVPGWFYIKKHEINPYDYGHKLVFCPALTGIAGVCSDIGIYDDSDRNSRLVLTQNNNPLVVQFEKATSSSAA